MFVRIQDTPTQVGLDSSAPIFLANPQETSLPNNTTSVFRDWLQFFRSSTYSIMAESIRVRRMTRERVILETENPDYFAYFKTDNLMEVDAFVIGTDDTPYEHKLIKLHFSIPENYPIVSFSRLLFFSLIEDFVSL